MNPEYQSVNFSPRTSISEVEEGFKLAPKFNDLGLMTCVTTDADSGEVLMIGMMNREALRQTLSTGYAHYFSRSRQRLWRKGETSGLTQAVVEARVDDDQDAIWLRVRVGGNQASCHVGYRSCFYRQIPLGPSVNPSSDLIFCEQEKVFDPEQVYAGIDNPTLL